MIYNPGAPCSRCKIAERTINSYCQPCNNIINDESFERNKNKPCTKCGVGVRLKKSTRCSECKKEYDKTDERLGGAKAKHLFYTYGLTLEDWEQMCRYQNWTCANPYCFNEIEVVDHCHSTGRNRGLLCQGCNKALGFLKEDIKRAQGLIIYIENNC